MTSMVTPTLIVALRNEKGSYSMTKDEKGKVLIVALRNEKGSYSIKNNEC